MKRKIIALALVFIIAAAGLIYYTLTNLDHIVKVAIEEYCSETLQTEVRIDSVNIDLDEGNAVINQLTVANPPGYSSLYAVEIGKLDAQIDIESINTDFLFIKQATVTSYTIDYEINETRKGNLFIMQDKINAVSSEPETQAATESDFRLKIKSLTFKNGTVRSKIVPLNDQSAEWSLPLLRYNNLGGRNGASPSEVSSQILDQFMARIRREIIKKGIGEEVRAGVKRKALKIKDKAVNTLNKTGKKVTNKLKNFFGN